MKVWTVIGSASDGEVCCSECAGVQGLLGDESEQERPEWHPLFASDEGAEDERCGVCGGDLLYEQVMDKDKELLVKAWAAREAALARGDLPRANRLGEQLYLITEAGDTSEAAMRKLESVVLEEEELCKSKCPNLTKCSRPSAASRSGWMPWTTGV